MTDDHYATLGVAPTSEDVVIRAAYLALMRRYHPDRNASPEAVDRAQAVIAAFAILGDPEQRMRYDWDRRRAAEHASVAPRRRLPVTPRGMAITLIALLSLVTFVALRAHLARRDPPAPVLVEQQVPAPAKIVPAAAGPAQDCTTPATQAAIKRHLLRRAAVLGGDQPGFAQSIAGSTVRVGAASFARRDPLRDTVECTAPVTLALPAGLAFAGGQRAVVADLDYSFRPRAAAGTPPILIPNSDLIAVRLAALAPSRAPDPADLPPTELAEVAPPAIRPAPVIRQVPVMRPAPQLAARTVRLPPAPRPTPVKIAEARPRPAPARPDTPRWTAAVAKAPAPTAQKSDAIAALERNSAAFYNQSYTYGKGDKRTALLSSRNAYLARREACRSDSCLRGASLNHVRDINAIMQSPAPKP